MHKFHIATLQLTLLCLLTTALSQCQYHENNTPKPYGYFRIDLPTHSYTVFDSITLPYTFEKSTHSYMQPNKHIHDWTNIVYPTLNAVVYISYKPLNDNLQRLSNESRELAYKHSIRADAIYEKTYENSDQKVYGVLYELTGNTASTLQFVLTDSIQHFLRAALYFENRPNADSIAPVAEYVKQDIQHLIESFRWKGRE